MLILLYNNERDFIFQKSSKNELFYEKIIGLETHHRSKIIHFCKNETSNQRRDSKAAGYSVGRQFQC